MLRNAALVEIGLSYQDFLCLTPGEILEMYQHHQDFQQAKNDFDLAQTRLIISSIINSAGKTYKGQIRPQQILKLSSEMKAARDYKPPTKEEVMKMVARMKGAKKGDSQAPN
jgi:hypothetical protein